MSESLESQVERLAEFIMENIPGEPSQSEGAIDTAIRLLSVSPVAPTGDDRKALDYAIRVPLAEMDVDYTPTHELIRAIQDSVLVAGFHRGVSVAQSSTSERES